LDGGDLVRIKSVVDYITSAAVIAAAVAVVWAQWPLLRHSSRQVKVPTSPISIAGMPTKGAATAPVVMIEFIDYQCPYCSRFAEEVLPQLERRYIADGRVLLAIGNLPLQQVHPLALQAARAAWCANAEGNFWTMHDALFAGQSQLAVPDLLAKAESVGLKRDAFEACLQSSEAREAITKEQSAALALGLAGTPVFLIGRHGEDGSVHARTRLEGARPFQEFTTAIEASLEAKGNH
jgi:protein-disulfide isomerase